MRLCLWVLVLFLVPFARGQEEPTFLVPPKRWAMIIGANAYPKFGNLSYASNDAKSFKTFLESNLSYDPANISLLTDEVDSKLTPTAENVTKELDRMLADPSLNKSDLFIFYFAGHGVGNEKADYLLPGDASPENVEKVGLPVKEVIDRLTKAKLRNVLVIADACRSGSTNTFGQELLVLTRSTNICVMLGAQPGQRSHEYPQLKHGVFTYCLLKALKNADSFDKDTGALWASKVAEDTSKQVKDYTIRDYPTAPQIPSAWVEKTKDVLLRLDPSHINDIAALKEMKSIRPDRSDGYLLYLIALAEYFIQAHKFAEALTALQAVDAINPDDERVGYFFSYAAEKLGRLGLADRIRTNILSKQIHGRYADEFALMPGTFAVPETDFQHAFENRWGESPWELRYYRLVNQLMATGRLELNYPRYLESLAKTAGEDKRKLLATEAAKLFYEKEYVKAEAKAREAANSPGSEPQRNALIMLAHTCCAQRADFQGAMKMLQVEAKDDPDLLLSLAFDARFNLENEIALDAMRQYLKGEIRPADVLTVWRNVSPDATLYKAFQEKIKPLSTADWRIRIVKGIFAWNENHDAKKFDEALSVIQEFKEEYPTRMAAFLQMMATTADMFGLVDNRRYTGYLNLFSMATVGLADADGDAEFWRQFHFISETVGFQHFFGLRAKVFLLNHPNLKLFPANLLGPIHRSLLQSGLNKEAAIVANVRPKEEVKALTLENEVVELFSLNRDAEAQAKLDELIKLNLTTSQEAFSLKRTLAEFYKAKAEDRPMKLTEDEKAAGVYSEIAIICDLERKSGGTTDAVTDKILHMRAVQANVPFYGRLFHALDWSKLSKDSRRQLFELFLNMHKLVPMLPALEGIPIVPGTKIADYAIKAEGDSNIRINALILPGHIALQVDDKGKATGTFKIGQEGPYDFTGTVDENGNLSADIKGAPIPLRISARLWPFKNPELADLAPTEWITFYFYTDNGDSGFCTLDLPKK